MCLSRYVRPAFRSRSWLHGALRTRVDCIERGRAADVKSISLLTAEAQVGDSFRYVDLAEQIAVSSVAAHAVLVGIAPTHGAPKTPGGVTAQPVGNAGLGHVRKDLAVRKLSGPDIHVEHADMRRVVRPVREAGVADIELLLVRREAKAVGLHEVIDDNLDITGFRIHPVDVFLFLLRLGFDALVIAADTVGWVAEPDRTVGRDDRVVRRVQFLAIVLVGDDGDRAVEFGPGDPSAAVFASEQASLPINGVAVRVHRWLAVYAHVTVVLREAHDAVVGNVAEQHVAASREVNRSLGPAESGCDALNRHGAGEGRETGRPERNLGLFHGLQARIRIAGPGQRSQGQRGLQGWGARLAQWRYSRRRGRFHGHGRCGQRRRALEQFAAVETTGLSVRVGQTW